VPTYDFLCSEGHTDTKRFDSWSHAPRHLKCSICRKRSERQFPMDVQFETFEPYESEAMGREPVYVGSRRDRDRALAHRGLRIKDRGE
jgi:hypothetical protein